MAQRFSFAAFAEYGNKSTPMQDAFKQTYKKASAQAGYPSKEEIGIIDDMTFDLTPILDEVPGLVGGFMDTDHAFNIPASKPDQTPASIYRSKVDEKEKEGVNHLGGVDTPYHTVIDAHEEVKVKNNTKDFKHSK